MIKNIIIFCLLITGVIGAYLLSTNKPKIAVANQKAELSCGCNNRCNCGCQKIGTCNCKK